MNGNRIASAILMVSMACQAGASPVPGARARLQELVARLRESPDDWALREEIIRLAIAVKPQPEVPDAAAESEGVAEYAFKTAKSEAEFMDAVRYYSEAALLAPWHAPYYFNLGLALEKAGKPEEAGRALEFYLLASPGATDKREVRKRIGVLKYAAKKAGSPEAQAERRREEERGWLRSLNGSRYLDVRKGPENTVTSTLDIVGDELIAGSMVEGADPSPWRESARTRLTGREFVLRWPATTINSWCWPNCPSGCTWLGSFNKHSGANCPEQGRISADGSSVTLEAPDRPHQTRTTVYARQ